MTDDTLREALVSLRTQREDVASEVERLGAELRDAESSLARLERAIEGLAPFLDEDIAILEDIDDETPDETPNETLDETPRESAWQQFDQPAPVRKKYPSTQMVGDLVNDLGRAIHRDEIVTAFADRFGFPPTWENPRNTLGNALLRAWERGLIERLDPDRFAPRGHEGALPRGGQ